MLSIPRLSPIPAIAVGVLHAGLASVLLVSDVRPNLALVATVLVASWSGLRPGVQWAFATGLTANLLSFEPLGSLPLALLPVAALAALGARGLASPGAAYPIAAVFAGSLAADAILLALRATVVGSPWTGYPVELALRAAALNAGIAAVLIASRHLATRRAAAAAA